MGKTKPKNYKDSDADGLPDEVEKFFGTNPLDPDTDKDGMPDGAEIKLGRNPRGPGLLKDLFIPHEGNSYRPHALHPHRLLFHAASVILIKLILIGFIVILPVEAWLTPDILVEQSKKIISLTNEIRKNLNLSSLIENSLLDQAAFNKAQNMLLNQYFAHTGPDGKKLSDWLSGVKYNYAVAGENLAMGFSSPEEVVNGWSRSQTHYQNMIDKDFKEIGVSLTSGLYANVDTTLVAQYFGAPVVAPAQAVEITPSQPLELESVSQPSPVSAPQALGEKVEPADMTRPQIDQAKSKLYVDEPSGKNNLIVRAEVYLSADTAKARVNFNNYFIDLKPNADISAPWIGQTIIFKQDQEQIFNPVVLATVTAEDAAGNRATADLTWENVKPTQTTALKQYFFIKQHQSPYIKPLFDITSIYYKIILAIASITLGLNILIQIKKQHLRVILSTLGLIGLLAVLIII